MATGAEPVNWSSWFFALLGVLIGILIKGAIDLFIKIQERRTTLEKMLIEKRLSAYEEIINAVGPASTGAVIIYENEMVLQPFILNELDKYYEWYHKFGNIYNAARHYIHRELDYKIYLLHNYFVNLNRSLHYIQVRRSTLENNKINIDKIKSEEFARLLRIGEIIYPDLKKLTSDVLKEAGKFFSSGLYKRKYTPSTLLNTAEYSAPEYFTHLALLSRGGELLNFAQFEFPSVQPPNPPGNNT